MKNILFLTSRFLPTPSTNGLLTYYISEELKKRGYNITCISTKNNGEEDFEVINEIEIHRISPSSFTVVNEELNLDKTKDKLKKLTNRISRSIKTGIKLYKFPNFDSQQNKKNQKKLEYILNKNKIDIVIGVNKPYSNVAVIREIKNKYPHIKFGVYYLDLINSINRPKVLPSRVYDYLVQKDNLSVLKKVDFIMIPPSGKKLYEENLFNNYRKKIHEIDFPTVLDLKMENTIKQNSRETVIMYAGTLDQKYRNPDELLKALLKVTEVIGRIRLNVYGKNNCESLFQKYENDSFKIKNYGIVSHETVVKSMMNTDFIVNIGNKNVNAVPSKIFELFSTGKPLINFINDENDMTKSYFELYPLVFNYNTLDNNKNNQKDFAHFLIDNKDRQVNTNEVKKLFYKNTPSYTADIIEKIINNN